VVIYLAEEHCETRHRSVESFNKSERRVIHKKHYKTTFTLDL